MPSLDRWSRRYIATACVFLVVWRAVETPWIPAPTGRSGLTLGMFGFIFTTVFAKTYTLVPSYYETRVPSPKTAAIQYPLSTAGVVLMSFWNGAVYRTGVYLWSLGVLVLLSTAAWSLRGHVLSGDTGTSSDKPERRKTDFAANIFMPVSYLYLAAGTLSLVLYGTTAITFHLYGAGSAALLIYSVGFRLLPRFLAVDTPSSLVPLVLPSAAVGPGLLAYGFFTGLQENVFKIGALLQSVAAVGFLIGYLWMFNATERSRVGLYAVLAAFCFSVVGVFLGLYFAFHGYAPGLTRAHSEVNLLGFLGLTVIGVAYQFYPPAVAGFTGASDRSAAGSVVAIAVGVSLVTVNGLVPHPWLVTAGTVLSFAGSVVYSYIVVGEFIERGMLENLTD
ncbi:MAG: hypothetical protein ABEK59_12785 [Halobacteria archaeon]